MPKLFTVRQIQEIFSFGKRQAYELVNSDGFPALRIEKRIFVPEDELEKYKKEAGDLVKSEEDVLSYALFPQVADKFLKERNNPTKKQEASNDENEVRVLYVDDASL